MTYGKVLKSVEDGEVVMLLGEVEIGEGPDEGDIMTDCLILVKGGLTDNLPGEIVTTGDLPDNWDELE